MAAKGKGKATAKKAPEQKTPPDQVDGDQKDKKPEKDAGAAPGTAPQCRCRECKHYPLRNQGPTSSIVEDLRIATRNWREEYCGTKPVRTDGKLKGDPLNAKIDCTGKKFEADKY